MDITFLAINTVDPKAYFPLASLIRSFLTNHKNVGTIYIERDKISFSKGVFFSVGKIYYEPYGLYYQNGTVYFNGENIPQCERDSLFTYLVNAIHQLKPGYVVKI